MTETNDIQDVVEVQPLTCPKCSAAMERVSVGTDAVDRCSKCKGLFFSAESHEHLMEMKGSEAIDTGAKFEEPREQKVRIRCPACHTQMIRMVDRHQPHIWYESCPVCFGIFMDAGEFREQKERRLVNVLRDMFHHQERP
ncbi:MAG TPA: zf-TFIIB domain-containing protein [Tepidisphaeraceae bacterium]|jgi:Zn-finger nucleic acid-binding protein